MEFEWDPAKADSNVTKHGVDFIAAADLFDTPDLLIFVDGARGQQQVDRSWP